MDIIVDGDEIDSFISLGRLLLRMVERANATKEIQRQRKEEKEEDDGDSAGNAPLRSSSHAPLDAAGRRK
jgi:hypothetical protein